MNEFNRYISIKLYLGNNEMQLFSYLWIFKDIFHYFSINDPDNYYVYHKYVDDINKYMIYNDIDLKQSIIYYSKNILSDSFELHLQEKKNVNLKENIISNYDKFIRIISKIRNYKNKKKIEYRYHWICEIYQK